MTQPLVNQFCAKSPTLEGCVPSKKETLPDKELSNYTKNLTDRFPLQHLI